MATLSFSQISSWLDCGERYRLERREKVPVPPAWYLVGGKAVHTVTQAIDTDAFDMRPDDAKLGALWTALFDEAVAQERADDKTDTPPENWRASRGRGFEWWQEHGLEMVRAWIRHRQDRAWHLFADDPGLGVELRVDGIYGSGQHRMVGYIDRLMMTSEGEPFLVDLKTGDKAPTSILQLALYADMLRTGPWQIDVAYGRYFVAPKGESTPMLPLGDFDRALIGAYADALGQAIDTQSYLPKPGIFCSSCAVRQHCSAKGLLYLPPPKGRAKPKLRPMETAKQEESHG